ncbi:hypothetical protein QCA50_013093 [Cerrena zonata]|uniref:Hydrophobin n=1 Tax=Cerrena zonata TaxID=2478898 RepID=A0AAW0FWL2_9APHY
MKQFQLINLPGFLLFILLATINSCFALCNGADAIMCCLTTGPASDPLIALQLLLAGITPPANTSIIGLGCSPVTGSASTCLTKLVGCSDNSHGLIAVGCDLQLQKAAAT